MSKLLLILLLLAYVCQYILAANSDEAKGSGGNSTDVTVIFSFGNVFHWFSVMLKPFNVLGNILSDVRVLLTNLLSMLATLLGSLASALRVFLFSLCNALEVFVGNLISDLGGGGNIMKM